MIQLTTRRRRVARNLARAGAVVSAAMLVVSLGAGSNASAAGANAGALLLQVPPPDASAGQPLTSGVQTTPFALVPPAGAACSGDSATGGYRVNSYIVPASVDPGTLQFDSNGPSPQVTGANLSEPLFSSSNTPFVNATTAVSTGQLTGLPPFSFAVFGASGPAVVPAGKYNVGLACTLGPKSPTQEDKYWNVHLVIVVVVVFVFVLVVVDEHDLACDDHDGACHDHVVDDEQLINDHDGSAVVGANGKRVG